MALRLGDTVPNFTQASSEGEIDFYKWAGDSWVVLFSLFGTLFGELLD